MTYYERLRKEPSAYDSPEDRMDSFMRLVEADERRRLKEEYRAERRKDELKGEPYDIFGSKRNS